MSPKKSSGKKEMRKDRDSYRYSVDINELAKKNLDELVKTFKIPAVEIFRIGVFLCYRYLIARLKGNFFCEVTKDGKTKTVLEIPYFFDVTSVRKRFETEDSP